MVLSHAGSLSKPRLVHRNSAYITMGTACKTLNDYTVYTGLKGYLMINFIHQHQW